MPDHPFALRDEPYAQDEVTFYRERDGLPPAGVGALAVAPDGTAWVGGLFGLARFDGGQWQQVGRDQPHCTLRVSSLLATGEALWVGMETGVARYQGGRWQRWWMDQPAPTRSARQLVADVSGKIWANIHRDASDARLTPWDLWRYDGEGWAPVEHPEPNLRALAAAPEGGLLAVNDEGLLRLEEGRYERWGTLPELAPGTKLTSLAVRGELVVVGTSGGLVVMEGGRGRLLRGQDGLPVEQVTGVAIGPEGEIWAADALGVARLGEGAWRYYSAGRWLLGSPSCIAPDGEGGLWATGGGGVSHLQFRQMTLGEKERDYEELLATRHNRHGFVAPMILFHPENQDAGLLDATDNDGLHVGMYLGAAAMRYAVTKCPEDARRAREAFAALSLLEAKTGLPGFPARAVMRKGERVISGSGEWHESPDPDWLWKGDTSSDETAGHYYGYYAYFRYGPPEDREALRALVSRETGRILEAPYFLPDYDGQPTRWARWEPPFLHSPEGADQTRLNSLEILSHLKVAHHITGEQRFLDGYRDLIDAHHYLDNVRGGVCLELGGDPQYDDHLAFLVWYPLLELEEDPELAALYREAVRADWEKSRLEANVLFNYIYATTGQRDFESRVSLQALRDIPLDLCNRATHNLHRSDLKQVPGIGGNLFYHPLPWNERPLADWEGNFYHLEGHGDGRHLIHGTHFVMAYWLGRLHGLIQPA